MSDDDPIQLFSRANACINDLFNWFCANKVSLNTRKTNCMLLQSPNKKYNFSNLNLSVSGNTLCREDSCKFLGILTNFCRGKALEIHKLKIYRSLFAMNQSKSVPPQGKFDNTVPFTDKFTYCLRNSCMGNVKRDILIPTSYKSVLYERFTIKNTIVAPIRFTNSQ